ncbi:hypothetical protein ABT369_53885 [Dactylosporangium sp. NPDC000244]|uniref:hypothetical protein n=1 Tax=Dactylosporangium sp. NPDC000244 TaxID=3154365 RepID=UPI00331A24A6
MTAGPQTDIDAGAGPGSYHVALDHAGRAEYLHQSRQVEQETVAADRDEWIAAWQRIAGIERYLVRIWPAT